MTLLLFSVWLRGEGVSGSKHLGMYAHGNVYVLLWAYKECAHMQMCVKHARVCIPVSTRVCMWVPGCTQA